MKAIAMNINVECAAARKNYDTLIDQDHIQDVIEHSEYIEKNREAIIQNFMALALLDCTNLIATELGGLLNGSAEITHN